MLVETATQTELVEDLDDSPAASSEQQTVNFTPAYLSVLGSAVLAACGGGGDGLGAPNAANADANANANGYRPSDTVNTENDAGNNSAAVGFNNFPVANTDNEAARFLLQSQLNASDAEIAAVRSTTFSAYLQQQFSKPIGQTGWDWLDASGYNATNIYNYFLNAYPGNFMIWNQLFTSQDSMRKRIALALSEFFVVSLASTPAHHGYAIAQYWDLLVANAFGNFRALLEAITLNPAMGYYLNTLGNSKENPATGRLPDENYAREVMQLFTIGLYQLNQDGTVKTDDAGRKLESYSQIDVSNLARVFTGYYFDNAVGKASVDIYNPDGSLSMYKGDSRDSVRRPMLLDESNHSTLAVSFLGTNIAANTPGATALKTALDALFNHPNVGPFFGKQMIQRFVTSSPSPTYVARVANAFNNNGAGVRGDLKAVWNAIFLDDEARRTYGVSTAPQVVPAISDRTFGKLREPMLRFVQWGRTFGLSPVNPAYKYWKIYATDSASNGLGQSPLMSPSVFNFFRPGYVPPNSALTATRTPAPEFQLVNESTVGAYLNFMQSAIRDGLATGDPELPQNSFATYKTHLRASYTQELALASNPAALVQRLNLLMAAGQISSATETLMITALTSMPVNSTTATTLADQRLDRVAAAVLMVMACSEYLIQK